MGLARALGSTYRDPTKITSGVARHLIKQSVLNADGRRTGYIHPSEASHPDFCPRASFFDITGIESAKDAPSLAMELVFERGHEDHRKWQGWLWEMGALYGKWLCINCGRRWWGVSPKQCRRCDAGVEFLRYLEVPVINETYLLAGQADGIAILLDEDDKPRKPIEVKTIGTGTVRIEAPQLIKQYTYKHTTEEGKSQAGVDWAKLWSGIRRPFPRHIKQGMLYCFCGEWPSMTYIYDPKFITAPPREFEVRFRIDLIEDILEKCLDVKRALSTGRAPKRPMWAEKTHPHCKECSFRKHCYGDR